MKTDLTEDVLYLMIDDADGIPRLVNNRASRSDRHVSVEGTRGLHRECKCLYINEPTGPFHRKLKSPNPGREVQRGVAKVRVAQKHASLIYPPPWVPVSVLQRPKDESVHRTSISVHEACVQSTRRALDCVQGHVKLEINYGDGAVHQLEVRDVHLEVRHLPAQHLDDGRQPDVGRHGIAAVKLHSVVVSRIVAEALAYREIRRYINLKFVEDSVDHTRVPVTKTLGVQIFVDNMDGHGDGSIG